MVSINYVKIKIIIKYVTITLSQTPVSALYCIFNFQNSTQARKYNKTIPTHSNNNYQTLRSTVQSLPTDLISMRARTEVAKGLDLFTVSIELCIY